MGIDVTAFGLPFLLTSWWREREREGGKISPKKDMEYRVFPDVKRIGKPKAVTSIPILLGHYRQLSPKLVPPEKEVFPIVIVRADNRRQTGRTYC